MTTYQLIVIFHLIPFVIYLISIFISYKILSNKPYYFSVAIISLLAIFAISLAILNTLKPWM